MKLLESAVIYIIVLGVADFVLIPLYGDVHLSSIAAILAVKAFAVLLFVIFLKVNDAFNKILKEQEKK